jgi:hypothetical protein
MISNEKILLLEDFMINKIDKSQLLIFLNKEYNFLEFTALLDEALETKQHQLFYTLFYFLPTRLSGIEEDKIYKKYISISEGHFEHEEMLSYFHKNFIAPEESIKILNDLILNPPKYFIADDRIDVFINKCLFTLEKQPVELGKNTLEDLTHSENLFIAKRAETYLLNWLTKNPQ